MGNDIPAGQLRIRVYDPHQRPVHDMLDVPKHVHDLLLRGEDNEAFRQMVIQWHLALSEIRYLEGELNRYKADRA